MNIEKFLKSQIFEELPDFVIFSWIFHKLPKLIAFYYSTYLAFKNQITSISKMISKYINSDSHIRNPAIDFSKILIFVVKQWSYLSHLRMSNFCIVKNMNSNHTNCILPNDMCVGNETDWLVYAPRRQMRQLK